jgi:hypothetical protein
MGPSPRKAAHAKTFRRCVAMRRGRKHRVSIVKQVLRRQGELSGAARGKGLPLSGAPRPLLFPCSTATRHRGSPEGGGWGLIRKPQKDRSLRGRRGAENCMGNLAFLCFLCVRNLQLGNNTESAKTVVVDDHGHPQGGAPPRTVCNARKPVCRPKDLYRERAVLLMLIPNPKKNWLLVDWVAGEPGNGAPALFSRRSAAFPKPAKHFLVSGWTSASNVGLDGWCGRSEGP